MQELPLCRNEIGVLLTREVHGGARAGYDRGLAAGHRLGDRQAVALAAVGMDEAVARREEGGEVRFGEIVREVDDPGAAGLRLQRADEIAGALIGIETLCAKVLDNERDR